MKTQSHYWGTRVHENCQKLGVNDTDDKQDRQVMENNKYTKTQTKTKHFKKNFKS